MNKRKNKFPSKDDTNKYLKYSGIAFQMFGTIILGYLLGRFLDNKFETNNILTAVCTLLFVIASLYLVLKEFIKK